MSSRALFIHHSVGRHLLVQGNVRAHINGIELWDHDYNRIGLSDPDGRPLHTSFSLPGDDTDPPALLRLFAGVDDEACAARAKILDFDVIAMKSCYPNSNISSQHQEHELRDIYRALLATLADIPREFVLVTSPPLVPLRTSRAAAARATGVARWLASEAASGIRNVRIFDLFSQLADGEGRLRREHRRALPIDAHPNAHAWVDIAPLFAKTLSEAAPHIVQGAR
jgi:hypothetical protein